MKRLCAPLSFIAVIFTLLSCSRSAFAQSDDEKNFLLLYFKEEELVAQSATRSPKPLSLVAENMTVITAADIELMNAHSVAEVLNTVPGVAVWLTGGPGQMATAYIQGSQTRHVTVIIDGVVLNNGSDDTVDLGMIPVQNIEKLEIIKGPASSAWGSALGGVVNIITKSGNSGVALSGGLSASYGTRNSGDFRAEARGKEDGLSYYFTAGRLQSDGLTPHFDVSENSAYTKLTYDLSDHTSLLFSLGYEKTSRGRGIFPLYDESDKNSLEVLHSTLSINSAISKNMELNISLRSTSQDFRDSYYVLSTGDPTGERPFKDKGYGSSAKLTWKGTDQTVVLGTDYDDKTLESNLIAGGEQEIKKAAFYGNDTLVLNKFSITPGIRYDHTNTDDNMTSPSLGVTYGLANNTILRAYAAKGFNIPTLYETYLNPDLNIETVWSYQAGAETTAVKYLWLKLSVFRNELRNPIENAVNTEKQRRQGVEFSLKTTPLYNTSLTAGAELVDAKDLVTGLRKQNVPTRVYDLGIRYDDERSFKALLQGRYIDWNADPSNEGKYGSFLFDLNIIKKVYRSQDATLEAFIDVHNIFDGSQYLYGAYATPGRWYEGGIRYKF